MPFAARRHPAVASARTHTRAWATDMGMFGEGVWTPAIFERDEPLIMGVVFFSAVLMLVGNVLSDLCVALVDPRVSYK